MHQRLARREDGPADVPALERLVDVRLRAAGDRQVLLHPGVAVHVGAAVDVGLHALEDQVAAERVFVEHGLAQQLRRHMGDARSPARCRCRCAPAGSPAARPTTADRAHRQRDGDQHARDAPGGLPADRRASAAARPGRVHRPAERLGQQHRRQHRQHRLLAHVLQRHVHERRPAASSRNGGTRTPRHSPRNRVMSSAPSNRVGCWKVALRHSRMLGSTFMPSTMNGNTRPAMPCGVASDEGGGDDAEEAPAADHAELGLHGIGCVEERFGRERADDAEPEDEAGVQVGPQHHQQRQLQRRRLALTARRRAAGRSRTPAAARRDVRPGEAGTAPGRRSSAPGRRSGRTAPSTAAARGRSWRRPAPAAAPDQQHDAAPAARQIGQRHQHLGAPLVGDPGLAGVGERERVGQRGPCGGRGSSARPRRASWCRRR